MSSQPNIVMIVSDEERRNDWLPAEVALPGHDRLRADGLSFRRHYTHSSPCSPSRASLYTGSYLAQHGVVDNVSFPTHTALDPATPTIGSLLSDVGYRCAYLGKWHLSHSTQPPMEDYGYHDWQGDDAHFTGSPWGGRYFDPIIAGQAIQWLRDHADDDQPWLLTVALVNPHDIMWFPADHSSYQEVNPRDKSVFDFLVDLRTKGVPLTAPPEDYPRLFDQLPANFDDDLHTKPEIQRAWRHVRNHEHFVGELALDDHESWLRQLDYYAWLHERLDESVVGILDALDELGIYDDTSIVYTSDHGDACGSHGLRAKLPCVYEEVMGVPLVVKAPGVTGGASTQALSTHVDLAATVCAMGGIEVDDSPTLAGVDLSPVLQDPGTSVRDHVFFSQDSGQSPLLNSVRYSVRGFFDGETKYARYYGVGGGILRDGTVTEGEKVFGPDAAFDDHDHEWYSAVEDPGELTNLAHDRGRRAHTRELFERLLEIERQELGAAVDHFG